MKAVPVERKAISAARLAASTFANAVFKAPLKMPSASRYAAFVATDAALRAFPAARASWRLA